MNHQHFTLKFFERTGLVATIETEEEFIVWPNNFSSDLQSMTLKKLQKSLFGNQDLKLNLYELVEIDESRAIHLSTVSNRNSVCSDSLKELQNAARQHRLMASEGIDRSTALKQAGLIELLNKKLTARQRKTPAVAISENENILTLFQEILEDEENIPARALQMLKNTANELDSQLETKNKDVLIALVADVITAVNAFEFELSKRIV